MTASFHYPPNQDAAKELLEKIFPRVRARIPAADLALVGQGMPEWLARMALEAGAKAVGQVADIRPELHRAWVSAAPLRLGAGSPLKVIEARAAGVPVVTVPRAAEALELGPAEGVLVATSDDDFAERLLQVLSDPVEQQRLGRAGIGAVRERFDRAVCSAALEKVWRELVAE